MGSYTPPSSEAEPPSFNQFFFEQTALVAVNQVLAAPKIFKTLQVTNLPKTDANVALDISVLNSHLQALVRKTGGAGAIRLAIMARFAGGTIQSQLEAIQTTSVTFIDMRSFNSSLFLLNADFVGGETSIDILLGAYVSVAGTTGELKNIRFATDVFIPKGATIVET